MITLACLGLVGTAIDDDGLEAAFRVAVDNATNHELAYVGEAMGMSMILVLRNLLDGDEAAARAAHRRFEEAYSQSLGAVTPVSRRLRRDLRPAHGGYRRLPCDRPLGIAEGRPARVDRLARRRRSHTDVSGSDRGARVAPPRPRALRLGVDDVRHVAVAGGTANDLVAGHRSGAFVVAGVLAGGHDRATLAAAPHTQLIDSIAELPTVVTSHEARSANSFM